MKFCLSVGLLLISLSFSSCSVGMALSGSENPALSRITIGTPREDVVKILGNEIDIYYEEKKEYYAYDIVLYNEPSVLRALGHAIADVLTLGFWEFIGSPLEAAVADRQRIVIEYDEFNNVAAIKYP